MSDKKMTVFISWSQPTSHSVAEILKEELDTLFNGKVEFWVSSVDIAAGNISINSIISALQRSHMAIVCLDSSNYKRPWIYYETGIVFGRNYNTQNDNLPVIFPVIFDDLKVDHFVKTPFYEMQLMRFNRENAFKITKSINEKSEEITGESILNQRSLDRFFDNIWPQLYGRIDTIIKQKISGGHNMITEDNVAEKLTKYSFPEPSYGDVLRYSSGFETFNFYKFLLENVTTRLYIFGRKNHKISERSFDSNYIKILENKVDLKILFLNPNSELAKSDIAQDISDFREKLIISIKDFIERYRKISEHNIEDNCRMYSEPRKSEIIIADDVVFYRDLAYTSDGKPEHFTDQAFFVASINSQLGTEYYKTFQSVWDNNSTSKITSTTEFSYGD